MDTIQFCGKYGYEKMNGGVSFKLVHVKKFIDTYTHLNSKDFTHDQLIKVKLFVMIDLYVSSYQNFIANDKEDKPINLIELPSLIFL